VPENKTGSCGIIDILDRRSRNPSPCMSTPSTNMRPSLMASRNNAATIDDLPAPVLPTIPTYDDNDNNSPRDYRLLLLFPPARWSRPNGSTLAARPDRNGDSRFRKRFSRVEANRPAVFRLFDKKTRVIIAAPAPPPVFVYLPGADPTTVSRGQFVYSSTLSTDVI